MPPVTHENLVLVTLDESISSLASVKQFARKVQLDKPFAFDTETRNCDGYLVLAPGVGSPLVMPYLRYSSSKQPSTFLN